MTTENLKSVLTDEELRVVEFDYDLPHWGENIIRVVEREVTLHQRNIIARLAAEVVRLRDTPSNNDHFYMDGHSVGLAENENRVKELESKLKAWEDAPVLVIARKQGIGGKIVDAGTYHLKPAEADDEVV